ncbi:MAG: hypothetical protein ACPG2B_07030 [Candidatus Puniceispirillaceae bacterium]
MGDIINLSEFRPHAPAPCAELSFESDYDKRRIETVRDHIENMLEDITQKEDLPLTVAMSAGRFAAMRMFQLQGRAETLAFIDQCITTAELCDDLVRQLDEDA